MCLGASKWAEPEAELNAHTPAADFESDRPRAETVAEDLRTLRDEDASIPGDFGTALAVTASRRLGARLA